MRSAWIWRGDSPVWYGDFFAFGVEKKNNFFLLNEFAIFFIMRAEKTQFDLN
jgi:hypothetical protein